MSDWRDRTDIAEWITEMGWFWFAMLIASLLAIAGAGLLWVGLR